MFVMCVERFILFYLNFSVMCEFIAASVFIFVTFAEDGLLGRIMLNNILKRICRRGKRIIVGFVV